MLSIYAWRLPYNALYCAIAKTDKEARALVLKRYPNFQPDTLKIIQGPPTYARPANCCFTILDRSSCSLF